jgi:hypothetical protein
MFQLSKTEWDAVKGEDYFYGTSTRRLNHTLWKMRNYYKPINRNLYPKRSLKMLCIIRVLQTNCSNIWKISQKIPIELWEQLFNIRFKKTIHPIRKIHSKQGTFSSTMRRFKWRPYLPRERNLLNKKNWRIKMQLRQIEHRWNYEIIIKKYVSSEGIAVRCWSAIDRELDIRLDRILTGYVRDSHLSCWNLRHCPYVD